MRKLLLVLAFLLSFVNTTKASHAAGGELTYSWISDSTYKITLKFYRDCSGILEPTTITCGYYNITNGYCGSTTLSKAPQPNGAAITVSCPNPVTSCNGGTFPGYREWVYEGTITFPSRANYWRIFVNISARNASIANLALNANSQSLYIETTLNNFDAQGNDSPYFPVQPIPYTCINTPYFFNCGAIDPNGDSLSYSIIQPRAINTVTPCPYNLPQDIGFSNTAIYNLWNNPLWTNNTFTLNPNTGQISFTPGAVQIAVISVLVKEFRNGIQIGSVIRDIQIIVMSCVGNNNSTSTIDQSTIVGLVNNGRIEGCAGSTISFCVNSQTSVPNGVLSVSVNNWSAPGSIVTNTNNGTNSVTTCFTWIPGPLDTGLKVISFIVKDSSCPPPGLIISKIFDVPIYIWPRTKAFTDSTICLGEYYTLNVIGGTQFTWSVLPGGSSITSMNCTNCTSPMISPTINTKYVVTSNLNNLCINKDTVDVNVIPIPQFNLGIDTVTCINNSLILNTHLTSLPTNNYSIKWLPSTYLNNDTIQTPLCTPTNDVTYIVKINSKNLSRCASYDTINVKVLKGFKLLTNDTAICAGNPINMNVQGDNRYTYSWSPTINVSDPNIMAPIILPDTSRLYTVKATKTGCKDSINTIYIDVQPNPIVYIGPDRNICFGDTIQLNPLITPSSYPYYSYSWSPIGSLSNPNIKQPVFQGLITKLVKLIVSTPAGCNGGDDAQFTVVPSNFLDTFIVNPLCPSDSVKILHPFSTQLNWIQWYPNLYIDSVNSETPTVWPTDNFTYLVVAQEVTGCIDSALVNVEVKSRATITLPDTITLFPGDSYQFIPGGNCLYFNWFPWNGLNNPNISSPTTSVQASIIYTVDAKTEFGCKTTDSVVVVVEDDSEIDVANSFTPGSEPNSIIKVQHHGIAKLGHFRIFNRWGQVVFETTNIDEGWDGTFNGVPQNIGVYIYTAEAYSYRGKRFYKQGNITLLR